MKLLLWICIWIGLFIELALGGIILRDGLRGNPGCLVVGLLFYFPVRDTINALRIVPWKSHVK